MPRTILDIEGLAERLPLTTHQIYKMVRRVDHPLPHKKMGRRLLFDWEAVLKWYDMLPGVDLTFNGDGER